MQVGCGHAQFSPGRMRLHMPAAPIVLAHAQQATVFCGRAPGVSLDSCRRLASLEATFRGAAESKWTGAAGK